MESLKLNFKSSKKFLHLCRIILRFCCFYFIQANWCFDIVREPGNPRHPKYQNNLSCLSPSYPIKHDRWPLTLRHPDCLVLLTFFQFSISASSIKSELQAVREKALSYRIARSWKISPCQLAFRRTKRMSEIKNQIILRNNWLYMKKS